MKEKIYTPDAPQAIGPYSQAIQYGDLLFISGQIPIDPKTGNLVLVETRQAGPGKISRYLFLAAQSYTK